MKKMMSMLLAMTLLLTPLLGVAQEATAIDLAMEAGKTLKTSLTLFAGDELVGSEAAEALANTSLNMTFATEPAAQVGFSLTQGENTLGDLMLEIGENSDLYISSTLLGDTVLRIDENETDALLDKALAFMVDFGMMTQEDVQAVREALEAVPVQQETAQPAAEVKTIEFSMFELMTMDYGPLMDAVTALAGKVEHNKDAHAPGNPEAAEYYGIDLTGEDFAQLADGVMAMVNSSKTLSGLLGDAQITKEQIEQALSIVKSLGVGAYIAKDGTLLHLTLLPVIALADGEYVGSISYSSKTEGAKTTCTLDVGLALDPVQGEYTVLFNMPAMLVLEENKATLTAEAFDVKVELTADVKEETMEAGTYNEANLRLALTDAAGETVKGAIQLSWNECLPTEAYPIQAYTVSVSLNDDQPKFGALLMVSAEDPAGEALAAQPYAQPAQMTQEEFNAFAEQLLMQLDQLMAIPQAQDMPAAA